MNGEAMQKNQPAREDRPFVLVTGSSGLIGSALSAELAQSFHVIGLDIEGPDDERRSGDWIRCDFTDEASVAEALRQVRERSAGRLASVVHLAAYYDFSGRPSELYEELTVRGTERLLRSLQGFEVGQFVFSSTILVLKPTKLGELLDEDSPLEAEWDYPESKLRAEAVIRREHGSIPFVLLRIAGVYDEDGHSPPITQHIRRIREKTAESYFFPGDIRSGQSYIHLDDLVRAVRRVVENREALGPEEIFLLAERDVMSYEELQDEIGQLLHGEEWPTVRIPKMAAKFGAWLKGRISSRERKPFIQPWMIDLADDSYPVEIERARERLGWEPRHRLRDTLPEMIRRLKADPRSWYEENKLPVPEDLTTAAGGSR